MCRKLLFNPDPRSLQSVAPTTGPKSSPIPNTKTFQTRFPMPAPPVELPVCCYEQMISRGRFLVRLVAYHRKFALQLLKLAAPCKADTRNRIGTAQSKRARISSNPRLASPVAPSLGLHGTTRATRLTSTCVYGFFPAGSDAHAPQDHTYIRSYPLLGPRGGYSPRLHST